MKFFRSLFLISGIVFVIFKIFENASCETRTELEKITIDLTPKGSKIIRHKVEIQQNTEESEQAAEEQAGVEDQLLDQLEDANKTERKQMMDDLSAKLHAGENILSQRQKLILDVLNKKDKVDTTLLQARIPDVTIRTLRRDLEALKDMGILTKIGTTKGSYYVRA